jgi:Domain of unknown function (DUF4062)
MAPTLTIFISSTRADLLQYRQRAQAVIEELRDVQEGRRQVVERSMEDAVQDGSLAGAMAVSRQWVAESDWVILIVAWNYGTIMADGSSAGLSVTEWEYNFSVAMNKKVFVFMAGEKGTATGYRPAAGEENLVAWFVDQSPEQQKKLRDFRSKLGSSHFLSYFRDIEHFEDLLRKTLWRNVDDLLPVIEPGSRLALLIIKVRPAFLACMASIRTLHHCKKIHDALHDLLAFVIKPIRDGVLPVWSGEAELSRANERRLTEARLQAGKLLQSIEGDSAALDAADAPRLLELVGTLAARETALDPFHDIADAEPVLGTFTESFDRFARIAQKAFKCANAKMYDEQDAFDGLHEALLTSLEKARREEHLKADEQAVLSEEIGKLALNKRRLLKALKVHAEWQDLHDEMTSEVDKQALAPDSYEDRLKEFFETHGKALQRLTAESVEKLDADPNLDSELAASLQSFATRLQAIGERIDAERFDRMRSAFDNSFYIVDKRVLGVVERLMDRVVQLEKVFEQLALAGERPDVVTAGAEVAAEVAAADNAASTADAAAAGADGSAGR